MDVAPTPINFLAVQTLWPATKGGLLGRRYISLGALPGCLASAYLIGAMLGVLRGRQVDELVKMFANEPESQNQIETIKASLAERVSERLDIYAHGNPQGDREPSSFLDFVMWTSKEALAAIGRHGRLLAIAQPGEWVEPEEKAARALALGLAVGDVQPADIYFNPSGQKVAYEPALVATLGAMFVAEGIIFGAQHSDLSIRMATNDLAVQQAEWAQARGAGLSILPESPPFVSAENVQERILFEVDYCFRPLRNSDPTGRSWGGGARAFPGEYKAWTQRSLGSTVVALYAFHTWKRTVEALRALRDTGPL